MATRTFRVAKQEGEHTKMERNNQKKGVIFGKVRVFSTEIYTRACHWFPRLLA
jgi:hypothetical protein